MIDLIKICEGIIYDELRDASFGYSGHNLLWMFSKRNYSESIMECLSETTSMGHNFRDKRIVRHRPMLDGKEGVANILRIAS